MFDKEKLLEVLHDLDRMLDTPADIVLIGGSAMTYMGLRTHSIDVDFFYDGMSDDKLCEVVEKISQDFNGARIDVWSTKEMLISDGRINRLELPKDYMDMCDIPDEEVFKYIRLRILSPIDIILTKVGRLADKDIKDMKTLVDTYKIPRQALEKRYQLYLQGYDGNPKKMKENFKSIIAILYD